jgi:anti-anti-sigma factor
VHDRDRGRVGLHHRGTTRAPLPPAFSPNGDPEVVIDLAAATFCDSAGIGALIQLRKLAEENGQRSRILNARTSVWSALDYSGLREYLRVE